MELPIFILYRTFFNGREVSLKPNVVSTMQYVIWDAVCVMNNVVQQILTGEIKQFQ